MPEEREIRYTPWEDIQGGLTPCLACRKEGNFSYGVMKKRRVTGRDGDSHLEYKVVCRSCKQSGGVYQSKQLAAATWSAKQVPDEDSRLKHRNRKPAEEKR